MPPIVVLISVTKTMQLRSGKTTTFVHKEDAKFLKELRKQCDNWVDGLTTYRDFENIDDLELLHSVHKINSFVKFVDHNLETILHINKMYWKDDQDTYDGIFKGLETQKDYLVADIFEVPKQQIKHLTEPTKMAMVLVVNIVQTTENILKKI